MSFARKALLVGATLIGTYLVVHYYTGAAKVEQAGSTGGVNLIKAFQGR